eukprot:1151629-Pelagomonas_calceolata.AAC.3
MLTCPGHVHGTWWGQTHSAAPEYLCHVNWLPESVGQHICLGKGITAKTPCQCLGAPVSDQLAARKCRSSHLQQKSDQGTMSLSFQHLVKSAGCQEMSHVSDEEEGKGFSWPNVEVVIWVDVLILLFQPCRFFDYKITRAQGANGLKRDICCGACEATDGFLII